jgi:hypothetical protein
MLTGSQSSSPERRLLPEGSTAAAGGGWPTRDQVLRAYRRNDDYRAAAAELGVPAGQAYLIATGLPADGGDPLAPDDSRPGLLDGSTQHLVYDRQAEANPTTSRQVLDWVRQRAEAI